MQLDTQGHKLLTAITSEERARRQAEVDFARGSVRYEGGTLPDEIERLNIRYIAGEIDSRELTAAILSSHTVQRF
ncbi:antitoxin VbhA family protein [Sphingomonas sp. GC_Shp_3]|jgi:hypothetical protein|uniref:antitoxin VbhA family protein n=1 Tax=Sphingomonas sp. GC_Shp_3 TaxID=2937383 RepID=UPI00226AA377|nr:antitoxin VbhA family protein [Sphingomonas sp. GC_Shp_3]